MALQQTFHNTTAKMQLNWDYLARIPMDSHSNTNNPILPPVAFQMENGAVVINPTLVIFDPIRQYKMDLECPMQDCNGAKLMSVGVYTQTKRHRPRRVYDNGGPYFLVASKYRCDSQKSHEIMSTDERLLDRIKENILLPFVITHKTVISRPMCNTIVRK